MQELVRLNGNVPLRMLLDILYYIRCNGFHSAPLWLKVEKALITVIGFAEIILQENKLFVSFSVMTMSMVFLRN